MTAQGVVVRLADRLRDRLPGVKAPLKGPSYVIGKSKSKFNTSQPLRVRESA